jgi:putative oxidoreductase
MEYLFLLGRILYGGYFLKAGINHFQSLAMLSGYAGMKGVPLPKVAVMFSGTLIIVGGLSVLLGAYPTIGLGCIVLFLVPVSLMMHTFWSDTDPMMKLNNQINFEKNIALAAAALMLMSMQQPWPLSMNLW